MTRDARYWKEKYEESERKRKQMVINYEQHMTRLFNNTANYREVWVWLHQQTWFKEHQHEVKKYVESMVTVEEKDPYVRQ